MITTLCSIFKYFKTCDKYNTRVVVYAYLAYMINNIKPQQFVLERNEYFPNNSLPVLFYKNVFTLEDNGNENADFMLEVFKRNNWLNGWKDSIYNYHHYHSTTHECLGTAAGTATIMLGGPKGITVEINTGDVLILPAGTGHKRITSSPGFLCVGAYPEGKDYDIKNGKEEEFTEALKNIQQLTIPAFDPVFGQESMLHTYWK